MKICVISDIHGLETWERIVEKEQDNVDRFVFLGDYVDSKDGLSTPEIQLDNLQSIREFKEEYLHVDLLIGNHDLQYIGGARCSGFNPRTFTLVQDTLMSMIRRKELQACVCHGKYLFSHAGISSIWMKERGMLNDADINRLFHANPLALDFVNRINCNGGGDNVYQSPLWIRPNSLSKSTVLNYHQVVGHTKIMEIGIIKLEKNKLIFTDTQLKQYLIIETESEIEDIKTS